MRGAGNRPIGRFFYWVLGLWMGCAMAYGAPNPQAGPVTTTVSDLFHIESVVPENFAGTVYFYVVTAVE